MVQKYPLAHPRVPEQCVAVPRGATRDLVLVVSSPLVERGRQRQYSFSPPSCVMRHVLYVLMVIRIVYSVSWVAPRCPRRFVIEGIGIFSRPPPTGAQPTAPTADTHRDQRVWAGKGKGKEKEV